MANQYHADICAEIESQIFDREFEIVSTEQVLALQHKLYENQHHYDTIIELAKELRYQFRYREAIELYSKAIELQPENAASYRQRAGSYLCTMQLSKSLTDFDVYCTMVPDAAEAIYRRGIVLYMMEQYEEASLEFESALKLNTQDEMTVAMVDWAWMAYMRQGHCDKAKSVLALVYDGMNIGHHTAYKLRTELYKGKKTANEVLCECNKYLDDDLEYVTIMYGLSNYYFITGEVERSYETLCQLLKRKNFWPAFAYLAALNDLYIRTGENNFYTMEKYLSGSSI